ncbi:carotenoid biosynthesis protein [Roseivirga sp. BDSF3-8]|uniref:carotenoid biosynthesis protein n=1 Tax=Roseivirga sp. BDSF3-8 TaxID=3241598 RepID=UPI003531FD1F
MAAYYSENKTVSTRGGTDKKLFMGAVALLVAMHLAGLIGYMHEDLRGLFLLLTPFNLLCMTGILLFFQQEKNRQFGLFVISAFVIGFSAEAVGVNTGILFGDYQYGATLGPGIKGVPIVIGFNWVVLTCVSGVLCQSLPVPSTVKALFASALLVLLDVFIEPVAVFFDFWAWKGGVIPWGNYAGWFAVGFVILLIFYKLKFNKQNPVAFPVFVIQLLFFLSLFIYVSIV